MDSKATEKLSPIKFNQKEIQSILNKGQEYKKDSVIVKKYQDDNNADKKNKYIVQNNNLFPFYLIVNNKFQRDDLCLNTYSNGDSYFGFYQNDKRNSSGLYTFSSEKTESGKFRLTEYYLGSWENDLKKGKGIYLWLKERDKKEKSFSSYKLAVFQAYIGKFEDDKPKKGILLKKRAKDFYIYYGKFGKDGTEKKGKNSFYYSYTLKQMYFGKFKGEKFVNGYVGKFDEQDKLVDIIKYYKKTMYEYEDIPKEEIDFCTKAMNDFLKVIKAKDYFQIVYDEFNKVNEVKMMYKAEDVQGKYGEICECLNGYNKINICEDIKNSVDVKK